MVDRISPLARVYHPGVYGKVGHQQVKMTEIPNLSLLQCAAWPETVRQVEASLVSDLKCPLTPGFSCASSGNKGSLLRIEPLKWWIVGAGQSIDQLGSAWLPDRAVMLDLSHSRCHLRLTGEAAAPLLNFYLPIDLRPAHCPVDTVISTAFHHVGVTLWKSNDGFELFMPRAFSVSLFELLCESAEQFGYELL